MPYPPSSTLVEYEFVCIKAPTCDVLSDAHGQECEDVNQHAREDFYREAIARDVGAAIIEAADQAAADFLHRARLGSATVLGRYYRSRATR